jgi:hypothetical protein
MSQEALSSQQMKYQYKGFSAPSPLGAVNKSTALSRTAWSNRQDEDSTPAPLNSKTFGSFYKFDDDGARPPM